LIPPLAIVGLLYQGIAGLQISLTQLETLLVVGGSLAIGVAAGLLAAIGGEWTRILVLSFTTVLFLDMAVHPSRLFDALTPSRRLAPARDAQRVADLHRIQEALEAYIRARGPLPTPDKYGEATGPETFWPGWWDLSAADGDGDGHYFLDFLIDLSLLDVPVDPLNVAPDPRDPRTGSQYVYFVVPPGYNYEGGACPVWKNRWVYMLAVSQFETETPRPFDSNCQCLWRDKPDFFESHFDYMLCGTFQR
jgi:hypothetical protein